jgi:ABC-type uncharacterized transport system auxiliary subunit
MRKVLFISILLFLVGCTTTYPPMTEYRVALKKSVKQPQSSCREKRLKVSQVFLRSSLMSKEMKYVVGEYKEFSYTQSQWAEDPNKLLSDILVQNLKESDIFASVVSYKSFSSANYTLESSVEDFTQYYSSDEKSSYVRVAMSFTLIATDKAEIVDTLRVVKKIDTKEPNAKSGVEALNVALNSILGELDGWIAKSCK